MQCFIVIASVLWYIAFLSAAGDFLRLLSLNAVMQLKIPVMQNQVCSVRNVSKYSDQSKERNLI